MTENINITLELKLHDSPAELISVEYQGDVEHAGLANKLAEVLEIEAAEILAELVNNPDAYEHHKRHCRLDLTCVDLHFETESKRHRFLARSKWEHVHRWGCRKFTVGIDACANLELREDGPKGPVLNEAKPIGHHKGCLGVWLVKPGPERYGV